MSWGCERDRGRNSVSDLPLRWRAVFLGTRPPRVPAWFLWLRLGLATVPGFLLSCGELGSALAALPSCCGDFCCCGAQAQVSGSAAVGHRFVHSMWDLPNEGSNLCPWHCKATLTREVPGQWFLISLVYGLLVYTLKIIYDCKELCLCLVDL